MDLELDTFSYEEDTTNGTVQMEQVENGTKVIVEYFPTNQSKESFESAEFSQVYDLLELSICRSDNNINHPVPEGTTEEEKIEITKAILDGTDVMLETILNLEDFKDVEIQSTRGTIPIYPILKSLREDYLLNNIMYFITYRATEYIDIEDVAKYDTGTLENIFKLTDTINETDEQRTQNIKKYLASKEWPLQMTYACYIIVV